MVRGRWVSWGEWVRAMRERRGVTQSTLARDCDVTQGEISKDESGSTPPSLRRVAECAAAFGVDMPRARWVRRVGYVVEVEWWLV